VALEEAAGEMENDKDIQVLRSISPESFEKMIGNILDDLGMQILETNWVNNREIDILANNPIEIVGGNYIVHGILVPEDEYVSSIRVIGLSDTVRAEAALKGILITTGYFSEEVQKYSEGAPMELINVNRLKEILVSRGLEN
tara:strand:+ start:97 stop:522 length:426 start_codon:yes stop_codon:yes gene_type:complete